MTAPPSGTRRITHEHPCDCPDFDKTVISDGSRFAVFDSAFVEHAPPDLLPKMFEVMAMTYEEHTEGGVERYVADVDVVARR